MDEAGEVHTVERGGKVESSSGGTLVRGRGRQWVTGLAAFVGGQLLDYERKQGRFAVNDGSIGRRIYQQRCGTEAGFLGEDEHEHQKDSGARCVLNML